MRTALRPTCRVPERSLEVFVRHARLRGMEFPVAEPSAMDCVVAQSLARALNAFREAHFQRPLRRAARHAAELAEASGYPLLVFPELFTELAIAAMLEAECRQFGRF